MFSTDIVIVYNLLRVWFRKTEFRSVDGHLLLLFHNADNIAVLFVNVLDKYSCNNVWVHGGWPVLARV
jgi:hypothetical protein